MVVLLLVVVLELLLSVVVAAAELLLEWRLVWLVWLALVVLGAVLLVAIRLLVDG